MKIKRIIPVLLALVMGMGLVSCTDGDNSSKTPTDNSMSSPVGTPSADQSTPSGTPSDIPANVPQSPLSVVVLGDSIARGYGLENVEDERFSKLLSEKLAPHYSSVDISNYGVDGMTGEELLAFLQANPPAEIAKCDYVLISIGGNNILGQLSSLAALENLMKGIDPQVLTDYILYLNAEEGQKDKFIYAVEGVSTLLKSIDSAFLSEDFAKLASDAKEKLSVEIPSIVSEIKKQNPNAKIMVQTVYNPYKNMVVTLPHIQQTVDMSAHGINAVSGLNEVIKSLSDEQGYAVADVWSAFEGASERPINAFFGLFPLTIEVDPHPNKIGHRIIAEVYYQLIKTGE